MEYLDTKHHIIDDTDKLPTVVGPSGSTTPQKSADPTPSPLKSVVPKEKPKPTLITKKSVSRFREFFSRVSITEQMMFVDNLSTMLKAGLPLAPALRTLSKETKNRYFKTILAQLEENVENGQLLSKGMKLYPKIFTEMVIASVEVGENTGMLPDTLGRLAITLKSQKALRSKVLGALMYPSIVLIALIAVSLLLALMVFPQLVTMFEEAKVELPFTLVAVRFVSNTVRDYYTYILAGLGALIILSKLVFKLPGPKLLLHLLLLKLPIAGRIIKDINLTRYAGNLHTLLGAGLAIVTSMEIVGRTLSNLRYRLATLAMVKELEKGISLDKAMEDRPHLFPSLAVQLCHVGAKTGELENILAKVSDFYETRVTNTLTNLSTIIEPVLLLTVGVAVGFIAISVISPMYELTLSFAE